MEQRVQQKTAVGRARFPWINSLLTLLYLALAVIAIWWPQTTLLERLRWLDSGICAQLLTHSLYPGGERLPLCSRNTGIYLGFFVTLTILYIRKRGRAQVLPTKSLSIVLSAGILFLAIDGINSFLVDLAAPHLYHPNNLLRLASGLLTGLAMGIFALPVVNGLIWRGNNTLRSLPAWAELSWFLPVLLLCFFAAASQSGWALYPLAILSTLGLLSAVGSINLIVLLLLSKRDESFMRYKELIPFCGIACLAATGELLLLAQLKLSLFQTLGIPIS